VAVFNAGCVATNETRPVLNVTLAQILRETQLTEFGTNLHELRLYQPVLCLKVARKNLQMADSTDKPTLELRVQSFGAATDLKFDSKGGCVQGLKE